MSSASLILNRLFTHSVFRDLISHEKSRVYSAVVERYIEDHNGKRNIDILDEIYYLMSKNYRNEYFYKNTLLTKLLLHRHSVNTTVALTQIPIGNSKADFVLINGKATVYEIKSELDNYTRLEAQLCDYFKAFNTVCVVAPEHEFEKLSKMLSDTPVGILCLTKRNTFSKENKKEPIVCNEKLEHRAIFKVLHKAEYEAILNKYFGEVPNVSQVYLYDACFDKFSSIPIDLAYSMALTMMKKRYKHTASQLKQAPHFLHSVLYFLNPSKKEYESLLSFLDKPFQGDR